MKNVSKIIGYLKSKVELIVKITILCIIRFYQKYISSLFGKNCIYYPTCSQYMLKAIERYGVLKGGYLGIKRLLRCTPFHKGGYDDVP